MKDSTVGFSWVVVLVGLSVIGFIMVQPALAQVASSTDSTSSEPVQVGSAGQASTSPETASAPAVAGTSTTTGDISNQTEQEASSSPTGDATEAASPAYSTPVTTPTAAPPEGLAEVHIIGTKYIDYFTDGATTFSFPGDPAIDSHLAEKDAPIPKHESLTWVHTTGQYLYDTPSGDLETGDYAVQPNGSYITNAPASVSATSSAVTTDDASTAPNDPSSYATTSDDNAAVPAVPAADASTSEPTQ